LPILRFLVGASAGYRPVPTATGLTRRACVIALPAQQATSRHNGAPGCGGTGGNVAGWWIKVGGGKRVGAGRPERSALLFDGRRWHVELLGLVLEIDGDLAESCFVLTSMVSAEQQLATTGQHRAQVSAGAAPIAAVGGGQGRWSQSCSHVHVLLIG
jgi:hypothetical protein